MSPGNALDSLLNAPTRRRVLRASVATLFGSALAGCTGSDADTTTSEATTEAASGGNTTTKRETTGEGTTTGTPDLDLREANVMEVAFTADGRTFDFAVTLYHDDDGEDGYANWWQVESLDGEQLGRRKLLHAHSTNPFTRSESIEIPEDVTCVVVRGHDQTHGYGGRVMLVNLESGATKAVRQGTEKLSFEASDCP